MSQRPEPGESAPYYLKYIDRITSDDIRGVFESQLKETLPVLSNISEETSRHRYAEGKWSMRQLLNHVNDSERIFVVRALWFARGFDSPLPGFDQEVSARSAGADEVSWASQVDEFHGIRLATISFFRNLPDEAWSRTGIASDLPFSVRALAYITAGHLVHHMEVLKEKYL